ncbi:MAG: hypothetical protein FH749_11930 [Firmicutes bacterium]|nr:hypothetical protein [Bacillota bacterium]
MLFQEVWPFLMLVTILLAHLLYIWTRLRLELGKRHFLMITPRKRAGLILIGLLIVLTIGLCIDAYRSIQVWQHSPENAEFFKEYYLRTMYRQILSAASSALMFVLYFWDGQVRERGIYTGRLYPLEQLQGFEHDGSVIKIHTTRKAFLSPKPKQIRWKLRTVGEARQVIGALKAIGINEAETPDSDD